MLIKKGRRRGLIPSNIQCVLFWLLLIRFQLAGLKRLAWGTSDGNANTSSDNSTTHASNNNSSLPLPSPHRSNSIGNTPDLRATPKSSKRRKASFSSSSHSIYSISTSTNNTPIIPTSINTNTIEPNTSAPGVSPPTTAVTSRVPKYPAPNARGLRLRKIGRSSHSQELNNSSQIPNKTAIRKGRATKSLDSLSLKSAIRNVLSGSGGGAGDVTTNECSTSAHPNTNHSSPSHALISDTTSSDHNVERVEEITTRNKSNKIFPIPFNNDNNSNSNNTSHPKSTYDPPCTYSYTSSHTTSIQESSSSKDIDEIFIKSSTANVTATPSPHDAISGPHYNESTSCPVSGEKLDKLDSHSYDPSFNRFSGDYMDTVPEGMQLSRYM